LTIAGVKAYTLYCHSVEKSFGFYKNILSKKKCNFSFFILDLVCEQEKLKEKEDNYEKIYE